MIVCDTTETHSAIGVLLHLSRDRGGISVGSLSLSLRPEMFSKIFSFGGGCFPVFSSLLFVHVPLEVELVSVHMQHLMMAKLLPPSIS